MREPVHRRRGSRSKKLLLVLAAIAVCAGGFLLVLALTLGIDGVARLFTTPWIEASSGRKFTPAGAAKRFMEKLSEQDPDR